MGNDVAEVKIRPEDYDQIARKLAQVYSLLLRIAAQKETADRGEFGDLTRPADGDASALEPDARV